jgi:hypothetical protein
MPAENYSKQIQRRAAELLSLSAHAQYGTSRRELRVRRAGGRAPCHDRPMTMVEIEPQPRIDTLVRLAAGGEARRTEYVGGVWFGGKPDVTGMTLRRSPNAPRGIRMRARCSPTNRRISRRRPDAARRDTVGHERPRRIVDRTSSAVTAVKQ